MESLPKNDPPKIPDMIMCGDHPSVTKTELNAKESRPDKLKIKLPITRSKITPSSSRTERPQPHAASEMLLRTSEPAPHAASSPYARADPLRGNKALVYAALGSFRWPPYLLFVWVLVLVLTHALHALVAVLDTSLPPLRKLCAYFRNWTEESWAAETDLNRRAVQLALGGATVVAYAAYCALYALHACALWSVEPLHAELPDEPSLAGYADDDAANELAVKH